MLRTLLRPRLWWLLVLPLAFYLTRAVTVRNQFRNPPVMDVSIEDYEANKDHYQFLSRKAFGQYYDANPYQVWQFVANACLVIGCLSVGKELLFTKHKA